MFAPYTSIPTNLLFFDRGGPTREVWYYEQPLPEGRKQYTKTAPIQFEEFADCLAWWPKREETERAWRVSAEIILANGCNLDIKNPRAKVDFEHLPPEQLADDILQKEFRIAEIMREIKALLRVGEAAAEPVVEPPPGKFKLGRGKGKLIKFIDDDEHLKDFEEYMS